MNLDELATAVDTLSRESALLSAQLFQVKTLPTADEVQAEILTRERFRTRIKALDGQLASKAAELRKAVADVAALRSLLEISDDTQKNDVKEIDAVRWNLIHDERDATKPFSPSTPNQ